MSSELTEEQKKRHDYVMRNLEDLKCDSCNVVIGKVFWGDPEGTRILCSVCGSKK